jgi:hypothetical protein
VIVLRQATKLRKGDVLALPFHRTTRIISDPERHGDDVHYLTSSGRQARPFIAMVPVLLDP